MLSRLLRYDSEPTPTERADDTGRRRGGETGRACPCPYFGKHGASASLPSPQSAVKLESRLGAVRSPLSSRCALAPAGYSGFSFDSILGIIWVRRGHSKTKNRYYENERTYRRLPWSAGAGGRHSLNTIATAPAAGLCGRCAALRTPRRHRPPETRAGGAGPAAARHLRTPAARPRTTAARPPRTTAAGRPQRPRTTAPRHTRTRDVPARARRATPRMGPDTRSGYRVPRTQRRCRLRPTRLQGTRTAPRTV